MTRVTLESIKKRFGSVQVLNGVSMAIEDGEFAVFVGPSGCGKTTLLRLIAGLEDISDGALNFDGHRVNDTAPVDRGIAMVFQSYALYPHMSVFENIAFGLRERKTPNDEITRKVREAAEILQIDHLLDRQPSALSGGQKQRVAIGRALVREPRVFLFDEPLSNLDAALRTQMRLELSRLHQRLKTTMIYVTHDQVEAMTLASKIFVLNGGNLEQVGTPREIYSRPNNRFVAEFVGSPRMNFLPCSAMPEGSEKLVLTMPDSQNVIVPAPASVTAHKVSSLGVRPENWILLPEASEDGIAARIEATEDLGGELLLHTDCGFARVTVKFPFSEDYKAGMTVRLTPDPAAVHLFDEKDQRL